VGLASAAGARERAGGALRLRWIVQFTTGTFRIVHRDKSRSIYESGAYNESGAYTEAPPSDLTPRMAMWFKFVKLDGVSLQKPGLYEWSIEGIGVYIGKYSRSRRPLKEYGRNVQKLIEGRPYRHSNPDGFRRIHRALEEARRRGNRITLTILENVTPSELHRREQELIRERGSLNEPPFGRK
jgi:hypothetical protein